MIAPVFHAWERRLAIIDQNRHIRPFEWGLDWLELDPNTADPNAAVETYVRDVMRDTDAFFQPPAYRDFTLTGDRLEFESASRTPYGR